MEPEKKLTAESGAMFQQGVGLVLSRWSALQLAVENEWGGHDSRLKAEQLVSDIVSWVHNSKEPLYIDDLELMLNETMESLCTMAEDGSIEEVAEKIMIMHEECLDGDFKSIENLREASSRRGPTPHVRQVVNDDKDSDEEDDDIDPSVGNDDSSNMIVDTPQSHTLGGQVNEPTTKPQAEDGWEVVGPRKSRGKRN